MMCIRRRTRHVSAATTMKNKAPDNDPVSSPVDSNLMWGGIPVVGSRLAGETRFARQRKPRHRPGTGWDFVNKALLISRSSNLESFAGSGTCRADTHQASSNCSLMGCRRLSSRAAIGVTSNHANKPCRPSSGNRTLGKKAKTISAPGKQSKRSKAKLRLSIHYRCFIKKASCGLSGWISQTGSAEAITVPSSACMTVKIHERGKTVPL